jgi:hypothetical protein
MQTGRLLFLPVLDTFQQYGVDELIRGGMDNSTAHNSHSTRVMARQHSQSLLRLLIYYILVTQLTGLINLSKVN